MQFLHRLLPDQCYYLRPNRLHFAFSYPKVGFRDSTAIGHGCFAPNWFAAIISAITGATPVSEGSSGQESILAERHMIDLPKNFVIASFSLMNSASAAAGSGHHSFGLLLINCAAAAD